MSNKRRGLGKGLGELLSIVEPKASPVEENLGIIPHAEPLLHLPIDTVVAGPFQPRQLMDEEALQQLSESIKTQGVLQPIVVRQKSASQYEIIAGERRFRAAQLAGLTEIPAIIKNVEDKTGFLIALIENMQRENLNPMEEARGLKRLADVVELSHQEVADMVGKSRAMVSNIIRLLSLNPDVQILVEKGLIEMGHARALLGLRGQMQTQVAKTVMHRGLSVRETERLVSRLQEGTPRQVFRVVDPNIRSLEQQLADKLGASVAIRHTKEGKGTLLIQYNGLEELEGILAHIQ